MIRRRLIGPHLIRTHLMELMGPRLSQVHAVRPYLVRPLPLRRRAFSLVELLVVLAILAILAGLTMSGVNYVRYRQNYRATEQGLFKLQTALDQQVKAITDQVRKERLSRSSPFTALVPWCDNDEDRAEALLLYCRLRQAFPQSYTEARTPFTIGSVSFPPHAAYADLSPVAAGTPTEEAAVLLNLAISRLGSGGTTFAADDAGITQKAVAGGTAFVDNWGTPIVLRRFFASAELNAAPYINPKTPFHDPFDPLGKLAANWSNKTIAQSLLGVTFDNSNRVLTVQSAGRDRTFGTADDLWGYPLRQLGARGKP